MSDEDEFDYEPILGIPIDRNRLHNEATIKVCRGELDAPLAAVVTAAILLERADPGGETSQGLIWAGLPALGEITLEYSATEAWHMLSDILGPEQARQWIRDYNVERSPPEAE